MSCHQNARQNHNIKIYNNPLEKAEYFKYLGTILTIQNSVQEEIRSRMRSGNICYHCAESFVLQFTTQTYKD
jgi:hypothetical protein